MDRIAVIVLPGLDGSGELRSRFAQSLGDGIDPVLVTYPPSETWGYEKLVPFVEAVIARHSRYVLLGESFSGPLACMLAARKPEGLAGLVLCATFCTPPRPGLRALAPIVRWLPLRLVPRGLLAWLLFGAWSRPDLLESLARTLRASDSAVLRFRAMEAAAVDATPTLTEIDVPAICLCGQSDRVVPLRASEKLCAGIPNAVLVPIKGPHALLQAVPETCAAGVLNFVESLSAC